MALNDITFLVPRERATTVNLYRAGAATVVRLVPAIMPVLRRKKDFRPQPLYASSFIAMNTTAPPFDDVRVRYAMNMATDKRRVPDLLGAGDIPASASSPRAPVTSRQSRSSFQSEDASTTSSLSIRGGARNSPWRRRTSSRPNRIFQRERRGKRFVGSGPSRSVASESWN